MNIFFKDIDAIDQFTTELAHNDPACPHCQQQGHLLSHGFVYQSPSSTGNKKPRGKRLFCSNRHQRSGCGKTTQLYLDSEIPHLQYDTSHLFVFITSLISMLSIQQAYETATHTSDPRNAYRWLKKMWSRLIFYRACVKPHFRKIIHFKSRVGRLQILLPTIEALLSKFEPFSLNQFQLTEKISLNCNAIAERFVKTLRAQCLDRLIFFSEDQLTKALKEYEVYFNLHRNHQGIGNILIDDDEREKLT